MKEIIIVLPSVLTVPAIKGGAVECLLEQFINQNEIEKRFKCIVIAHYFKGVEKYKNKYQMTKFIYIKYPVFFIRINSVMKNKVFHNMPDLYANKIVKIIKNMSINTVLIEGGETFAFLLKQTAPNKQVILHTHAPKIHISSETELKSFLKIDRILTVSKYCTNENLKIRKNTEDVITIENGIDTKRFYEENIYKDELAIRRKFNLPSKGKIILFKGRIVKEKGILELIRAFKQVEDKDTLLVIAGSKNFGLKRLFKSAYERNLMNMIKSDNRIFFLGYVPYNEVPLLNKISYFSVIPSLWEEPCALVLLENIASGKPTIVTNSGGMPSYVENKGGLIIEKENIVNNLIKGMDTLLNYQEVYQDLEFEAKKYKDYYNEKNYYKSMCNAISKK